jgi:ABC-type polysaccharide/polyol phosphate transport system ATPase subunit
LAAVSSGPPAAPAVIAHDVNKSFALPQEKVHTFKERALHPFKRTEFTVLEALRDVSFTVEHGEFFGIVGRNGSGKSTLLKCLAGIYGIDSGAIYADGRISTFIELGVGFNMDLAARDNATLNAIMLGLNKRDADARYQRILDFSELHEFEDLKLKNYSSGMLVRLAFSVMIQVDADILLIDEVLAVGDASFQQKCYDSFDRLRDERRTILFVTHDMSAVARFCDRALLLERGKVVGIDSAHRIGDRYFELNFGGGQATTPPSSEAGRRGDRSAEILEGWFEDERGARTSTLSQGRPCSYCSRVRLHGSVEDPSFATVFEDGDHRAIFAASNIWHEQRSGAFNAGEEVVVRIAFENAFAPGRYWATTTVARPGAGNDVLDRRERLASVVVTGNRAGGGAVDLPHDLTIEPVSAPQLTERST